MADEIHERFSRWREDEPSPRRRRRTVWAIATLLVLLVLGYGFLWWFVERVEVRPNQILVLVNKMGRTIPHRVGDRLVGDQVVLYPALVSAIARDTGWSEERVRHGYKGIRYEVLREGRYFFNPLFYERRVEAATLIPDGQFGVKIRKYGRPLGEGRICAVADDERGPVAGTLKPGRHDLNPYAYDVQLYDKIVVPEGFVGVQTVLSGKEPAEPNEYLVAPGERGVQTETLGPGTYFDKNPYEIRVDLVDMRSQKYDMLAADAIEFPSNDGFSIRMEATVEWAIYADRAPMVIVEVGDLEDVVAKVIRPYTTSLARIQGSKMTARDFIGAREAFQKRLFDDLRAKSREQGVLIKAVSVRDLKPPERVRSIIRERELADQTMAKYENEIAEAVARANLVEQEEMALQQQAIGDVNKEVVTLTVKADQYRAVQITDANKRLDVAKLDLESARKQAAAVIARGQADAKVVLLKYEAETEPLRAAIRAFGDGYAYAQNQFYLKVAPAMKSILSNTEGPFADIFRSFRENRAGPRAGLNQSPKAALAEHPSVPAPGTDTNR